MLGVDQYALSGVHSYGTVLVDVEARRPVDTLPERPADAFAAWLASHPGTQLICRDRDGSLRRQRRPRRTAAIQVADR